MFSSFMTARRRQWLKSYTIWILLVLAFLYAIMFVYKVFLLIPIPTDPSVIQHMTEDYNPDSDYPKILHYSWKTEEIPAMWRRSYNSCVSLNQDYKMMLWTDAKIETFLNEHYPWFKKQFDSYKFIIQRMDIFRLFIVYHYGGVYIDLDIQCNYPFDAILKDISKDHGIVMPATWHAGVLNELIMAKRHHPFLKYIISKLKYANHEYGFHYYTILASTGPLFVSRCLESYPDRPDVYQMPMVQHKFQYFQPIEGDTWQRWDMWLVNWWVSWVMASAVAFLAVACCVLKCSCCSGKCDSMI